VRLGSSASNTYVNAPDLLMPSLQVASRKSLFLAGQIVGVEGYVESAAMGILAGMNALGCCGASDGRAAAHDGARLFDRLRDRAWPKGFQPMNANYGLFPPLARPLRGARRSSPSRSAGSRISTAGADGLAGGAAGAASVA
jgi:methylenetetrahydrofolate--tRNA-(uracil-5-)-methyltransferase